MYCRHVPGWMVTTNRDEWVLITIITWHFIHPMNVRIILLKVDYGSPSESLVRDLAKRPGNKKSASRPLKSKFLRVFIPSVRRKLEFDRLFEPCAPSGPHLAAHAAEPKAPEGTVKQSIPHGHSNHFQTWDESPFVINTFCDWRLLLSKAPALTAHA